jgi:hypothetical protein
VIGRTDPDHRTWRQSEIRRHLACTLESNERHWTRARLFEGRQAGGRHGEVGKMHDAFSRHWRQPVTVYLAPAVLRSIRHVARFTDTASFGYIQPLELDLTRS